MKNYKELEPILGKDLSEKIYKVECVYKYLYDNIPKPSYDYGYGWENVHKSIAHEEDAKRSIRETCMMAAISIVFNIHPELAKKVTSTLEQVICKKEIQESNERRNKYAQAAIDERTQKLGKEAIRIVKEKEPWRY